MTFADIPAGVEIFLDANVLVYHFVGHAVFGAACTSFLESIERQEIQGHTSSHVLGEMVHRLMTIEACAMFGWPSQGIAQRLRKHPAEVQQLSHYRKAMDEIVLLGIRVFSVAGSQIAVAADISKQIGLLNSDGLVVALMREQNLLHLASNDSDFDRVPGITRYAPN